jgi:CBS domain-containing protein
VAENPEIKPAQEQNRATKAAVQAASETAQRGAAAFEQAGRNSSEAMRRTGNTSATTISHLGSATADTVQQTSQEFANTQREFVQGLAEQFESSISQLAQSMQQTAQEWRTVAQLPNFSGAGFQDLQRSVSGAVESVMRTNLNAVRAIFRLANPAAFAEVQQRFIRDYLGALIEGSAVVTQAVRRSADESLRPMEQHLQNRQREGNGSERSGRVADVMTRDVRIAKPDDSVQDVARLMRENDTGVLPVGEDDRVVGMVTDRDVAVRLVAEGRDATRTKVRDVMTSDVRYVFEDEDISQVAQTMARQQVRRLPVMNRQKRLVGVVSLGDIAQGIRPDAAADALRGIARSGGSHMQSAAE